MAIGNQAASGLNISGSFIDQDISRKSSVMQSITVKPEIKRAFSGVAPRTPFGMDLLCTWPENAPLADMAGLAIIVDIVPVIVGFHFGLHYAVCRVYLDEGPHTSRAA
jgi:hypothetical protein